MIGAARPDESPRRALVLAGGGLRSSWQAGVLRALIEAGLRFHLVDATSAGAINTAMWLSGQSPEEMGERWRAQRPFDAVRPRGLTDYLRISRMTSLGSSDPFRDRILASLGIDLERVRRVTDLEAWFNVFSYTRMDVECVPHSSIDEDLFIAGISLPGMFQPVTRDGSTYVDAGFVRNANLLEAVRRGAEELWVAWPMLPSPRYRGGPLQLYFQTLEMSANARLQDDLRQIEELNERVRRGERPDGRVAPVVVHVIRPPQRLPLDVALMFKGASHGALVDQGYQDAWRYLEEGAPEPPRSKATVATHGPSSLGTPRGATFRASMSGPFALGVPGTSAGARRGREAGTRLSLHVAVSLDLAALRSDEPSAAAVAGRLDLEPFGRAIPARSGSFRVIRTPARSPRRVEYQLTFVLDGRWHCLLARTASPDRGSLDVTLIDGEDAGGEIIGAGVLRLGAAGFARMAATLRPEGTDGMVDGVRALAASAPALFSHI